ncbi:MAG: peptidoglycan-binding protein, partial [Nannocystaceae bacterium]
PPGLTAQQREYIARLLAMERSPAVLASLIAWLKTLPPSKERDSTIAMAQALRLQVLEAQSTSETLQKVDQVIKSPGWPQVKEASKPAAPLPAPEPVITPSPPAPVPAPSPTALPLPEAPAVVPVSPTPQPLPQQLTATERAAIDMVKHLRAIEQQYGGPKGAKGRQNKTLVKAFQQAAGQKADGLPGPKTLYSAAAQRAVELPLVMYWTRGSTQKTVQQYRDMLGRLADALDSKGRAREAESLRASANRERGQGGVA